MVSNSEILACVSKIKMMGSLKNGNSWEHTRLLESKERTDELEKKHTNLGVPRTLKHKKHAIK